MQGIRRALHRRWHTVRRAGPRAAAGEERGGFEDLYLVGEGLLFEVDTAVESACTEALERCGQGSRFERAAVIECEIAYAGDRGGDDHLTQHGASGEGLVADEDEGLGQFDGFGDGDGLEGLAIGKRPLGDEADGGLVLEDILSPDLIGGGDDAVIDDEDPFLPFLLVGIDAGSGERLFSDRGDGERDDHFLQVLAVAESLMVDAVDACRQFNALQGLVALESACCDEPCAFGYDELGFDGLIRGDQDRVEPQGTVRPIGLVEHESRAVKRRTIDALDGLRQDDGGEGLAALERLVTYRHDRVALLADGDGLRDKQIAGRLGVRTDLRREMIVIHGIKYVLELYVLRM